MEKYADMTGKGDQVEIRSGDLKGQQGIVKEASEGKLKVQLRSGEEVEVDEMACAISNPKAQT